MGSVVKVSARRNRRGIKLLFGATLIGASVAFAMLLDDSLAERDSLALLNHDEAFAREREDSSEARLRSPSGSGSVVATPLSSPAPLLADPNAEAGREAARIAAARTVLEHEGEPVRVSGRVVDVDGAAIEGAVVRLLPNAKSLVSAGLPEPSVQSRGMVGFRKVIHGEPLLAVLPSAVSDAEGGFMIEAALRRPDVPTWRPAGTLMPLEADLVVTQVGATTRVETLEFEESEALTGDLVLAPEARVVGRFVDDFGAPLSDVPVLVWRRSRDLDFLGEAAPKGSRFVILPELAHTASDAEGRFELDGLWEGSIQLSLSTPGRIPFDEWVTLTTGVTTDLGDRTLEAGHAVEGAVVDRDGAPVSGAEVIAAAQRPFGTSGGCVITSYPTGGDVLLDELRQVREWQSFLRAETDASGRFHISGIDAEAQPNLSLYVSASGREVQRVDDIPPGQRDLLVWLQPEARLELEFIDDLSGAPVSAPPFKAERLSTKSGTQFDSELPVLEGELARAHDPAFVPGFGRCLVTGTGPMGTRVQVTGGGWAHAPTDVDGQDLGSRAREVVRLVREAGLRGVVRDAAGVPVEKARVKFRGRGLSTDAEGGYAFVGLSAGKGTLTASLRKHAPAEASTVEVVAGEVLEVPLVLRMPARVEIALADEGASSRGIRFTLQSRAADGSWTSAGQRSTDKQGQAAFADLPPGGYRVVAPWTTTAFFELAEGEASTFEFVPPVPSRVHGRVSSGGEPVSGLRVAAEQLRPLVEEAKRSQAGQVPFSPAKVKESTGESGDFELSLPFPGRYALTLSGSQLVSPATRIVEVAGGEDRLLDFELPTGVVAGALFDAPSGTALARVEVLLCSDDDFVVGSTRTNAAGGFRFERVAAGTWRLFSESSIQMEEGVSGRYHDPIELGDGEQLEGLLLEAPRGARLRGRALAETGAPSSDGVYAVRVRDGAAVPSTAFRVGSVDRRREGGLLKRRVVAREKPDALGVGTWGVGLYSIAALEPGEWRVGLAPVGLFGRVLTLDQNAIDELVLGGVRVVLSEGDDLELDLQAGR